MLVRILRLGNGDKASNIIDLLFYSSTVDWLHRIVFPACTQVQNKWRQFVGNNVKYFFLCFSPDIQRLAFFEIHRIDSDNVFNSLTYALRRRKQIAIR